MEGLGLTPRETEVAALYFVDERPQPLIAAWLGLSLQSVKNYVRRASLKRPELKALRHRGAPRPRVTPFSNVGPAHAPFALE
jgi:DNA-binding CsgD family transcriptional regulator